MPQTPCNYWRFTKIGQQQYVTDDEKEQKRKGHTLWWNCNWNRKKSRQADNHEEDSKRRNQKETKESYFSRPSLTTSYQTCMLNRNWHTVWLTPVGNRVTSRHTPQKKTQTKRNTRKQCIFALVLLWHCFSLWWHLRLCSAHATWTSLNQVWPSSLKIVRKSVGLWLDKIRTSENMHLVYSLYQMTTSPSIVMTKLVTSSYQTFSYINKMKELIRFARCPSIPIGPFCAVY